jgi:hypothetical protein
MKAAAFWAGSVGRRKRQHLDQQHDNFLGWRCAAVRLSPRELPARNEDRRAISAPGGYIGGGMQLMVDIGVGLAGGAWVSNNRQETRRRSAASMKRRRLSVCGRGRRDLSWYGETCEVAADRAGASAINAIRFARHAAVLYHLLRCAHCDSRFLADDWRLSGETSRRSNVSSWPFSD